MNSNISRKPSRPTGALVDCAPMQDWAPSGPSLDLRRQPFPSSDSPFVTRVAHPATLSPLLPHFCDFSALFPTLPSRAMLPIFLNFLHCFAFCLSRAIENFIYKDWILDYHPCNIPPVVKQPSEMSTAAAVYNLHHNITWACNLKGDLMQQCSKQGRRDFVSCPWKDMWKMSCAIS